MKFLVLASLIFSSTAFAKDILNCDNAALAVSTSSKAGLYDLRVQSPKIVSYLESEILKTRSAQAVDVVIKEDRTLVIKGMTLSNNSRFLTRQYGPSLSADGGGAKLVLTYFQMTGSHSYDFYQIANWKFQRCTTL